MAIFSHNSRSIAYQTEFAPFRHDLLLLQSSRFSMEFWRPILESLGDLPRSSGRLVTCEWYDKLRDEAQMAEDLNAWIKTLGLQDLHVVACADAVDTVNEFEKLYPGRIEKTLFYPQMVPPAQDLTRFIREFSQI